MYGTLSQTVCSFKFISFVLFFPLRWRSNLGVRLYLESTQRDSLNTVFLASFFGFGPLTCVNGSFIWTIRFSLSFKDNFLYLSPTISKTMSVLNRQTGTRLRLITLITVYLPLLLIRSSDYLYQTPCPCSAVYCFSLYIFPLYEISFISLTRPAYFFW